MGKYQQKIYDIIYKSRRHLTAEDIYQELKELEPKVVLATVYNNLNAMYEKDIISKVVVDGMPDHYDQTIRHDHLICKNCGDIADFTFTELTKSIERQLGQKIIGYDLKVDYLCPKCQKKAH